MIEIVVFSAIAIEGVVEVFVGVPLDAFDNLRKYKFTQRYIALALGVGVAFGFGLDVLAAYATAPVTIIGTAITGALIGSGARVAHQIISRFVPANKGNSTDRSKDEKDPEWWGGDEAASSEIHKG